MVSKQKNAGSNVFRVRLLSLVGVVAGLLPLQLRAATQCYWNGLAGDGLWTNAVNWTGRVPQDGDLVYFRCGGTHRVNLEGVTNTLTVVYLGWENDDAKPKTKMTLVGGNLSTARSINKFFSGNEICLEGVELSCGSSINCDGTAKLELTKGARVSADKITIGENGRFDIDRSSVLSRVDLGANATFRMTPGSEFKTKGEEMRANSATVFDVTGGRFVVGRETVTKGWTSAIGFVNTHRFADRLDEYIVEYPTGGEMRMLKPGLLPNVSGVNQANIGWTVETVFLVSGGTSESPVPCQTLRSIAKNGLARGIVIEPNTHATLSKDKDAAVQFLARDIRIGANAVVTLTGVNPCLMAYGSSFVDPTAKIKLDLSEASLATAKTYPIFLGAPGAADLATNQFELVNVPASGADWSIVCVGPCAYLTNGSVPDATANGCWTGNGADNKFSTEANWSNTTDWRKNPFMRGEKNTVINYDYSGALTKRIGFDSCFAPFILTNLPVKVNNGQTGFGTSSSAYNTSQYPVIFMSSFQPGAGSATSAGSIDSSGAGYTAFMGDLCPEEREMYFRGNVLVGGTAKAKTIHFSPKLDSRMTALHILSGGTMTVSKQVTDNAQDALLVVEGGGTLTFAAGEGAAFAYSTVENQHVVDGLLDIQVPFSGSSDIGFIGTGVVQVARVVAPASGASTVKLAGGVTFKPTAWETDQITLAVPSGEEGVLEVAANATGDHGNLIAVGRDATLVKTGAGALRFSMPATIDGTLDVRSGSVELAGALKTAADSGYVDVLTAADISGTIQVPEKYGFRIIKNADGNKVLCMREKKGLMLIFR